jgi:hypothetical protein
VLRGGAGDILRVAMEGRLSFDVFGESPCFCEPPKNDCILPWNIGSLEALEGVFGICGIPLGIAGEDVVVGGAGDPCCVAMEGIVTSSCFCAPPKNEPGTPGNFPRG